jgi:SAM-dependent methyltransferase
MASDKNFNQYARYYQAIYKDKNYTEEADYVHSLLNTFNKSSGSLLDLGCGSGEHAYHFAKLGYQVHGVDLSVQMIERANLIRQDCPNELINKLEFDVGDIRNCQLNKQFDVVTSLFHVMGYQTKNDDVVAAFKTVFEHLKPGGIFIFDYWHGPGVLTDQPAVRVKRFKDDTGQIIRIAEPTLYPRENVVNVGYTIQVMDKTNGQLEQFTEDHRVRYFFEPELQHMLDNAWGGCEILLSEEWLTRKELGFDSWFGIFVIRKPQ